MEDEHDDTDLEVGMNLPGLLSVGELRGLLSDVVSFEIEEVSRFDKRDEGHLPFKAGRLLGYPPSSRELLH